MALTTSEIISGAALLLAILSAAWQRFGVMIDIQKQIAKVQMEFFQKIDSYHITCPGPVLDGRLAKQEIKMDLFWAGVQDSVKNMLKHPTLLRKDELLDRYPSLECPELVELRDILMEEKTVLIAQVSGLDASQKIYLISLAIMLAGIDAKLIDFQKE